ncbi:MAG: hypothetical protein ED558_05000 [Oricola sp.]|nr:MAG: hypothetical protein ED558_05000 [Oricola sp.]
MLLRFSVKNHRSLRDQASINLTPAKLREQSSYLLKCEDAGVDALPVCIVYGANASGKSNLLDAIAYARHVVLQSHSRWSPREGTHRVTFKLDQSSRDDETEIALDFVADGTLFQYGFALNSECFTSEWLYAYPKNRKQTWYERESQTFKFGDYIRGPVSRVSELTRPNSLFISTAIQNNLHSLDHIHEFFRRIFPGRSYISPGGVADVDSSQLSGIFGFLSVADTGIVDVRVEKEKRTEFQKELVGRLFDVLSSEIDSGDDRGESAEKLNVDRLFPDEFDRVSFGHRASGEDAVFLDLDEESEGTIRLANLLARVLPALQSGGVVLLDELDASLHPAISLKIVELFASPETNVGKAQLIATTHDSNILCSEHLRRDEIWFVEKDMTGSSHVYPLLEFSVRNTDNLEKGYLEGRYGAVPFVGSMKRIRDLLQSDDR